MEQHSLPVYHKQADPSAYTEAKPTSVQSQ